jgi:hypothetical protein
MGSLSIECYLEAEPYPRRIASFEPTAIGTFHYSFAHHTIISAAIRATNISSIVRTVMPLSRIITTIGDEWSRFIYHFTAHVYLLAFISSLLMHQALIIDRLDALPLTALGFAPHTSLPHVGIIIDEALPIPQVI